MSQMIKSGNCFLATSRPSTPSLAVKVRNPRVSRAFTVSDWTAESSSMTRIFFMLCQAPGFVPFSPSAADVRSPDFDRQRFYSPGRDHGKPESLDSTTNGEKDWRCCQDAPAHGGCTTRIFTASVLPGYQKKYLAQFVGLAVERVHGEFSTPRKRRKRRFCHAPAHGPGGNFCVARFSVCSTMQHPMMNGHRYERGSYRDAGD